MNKKSKLSGKLTSYMAATGAFLAVGSVAQGQVVYTNVDPDVTLSGTTNSSFNVDMNHDGTADFTLNHTALVYGSGSGFTYFYANIVNNNASFGLAGVSSLNALPAGEIVDVNDSFTAPQNNHNVGSNYSGNFPNAGDKYIGVRFTTGTDHHYGWILVNASTAAASLTIKGYGYESQVGVGIHAGDSIGVFTDSLSVNIVNDTTAIGHFFPSAAGTAYYVVQLHNDTVPTQAQIIAGTGANGATVPCFGNKVVAAGVDDVFNFTGLTGNTEYTFYLLMTDTSGITSMVDSTVFTTITTGIESQENDGFRVYPVPAHNELNICLKESGTLAILNITGAVVYSKEINAGTSRIDVSGLDKGSYILEIRSKTGVSRRQIIKQ